MKEKIKIKLYRGDCLDVMVNLPDKSINFIIADLPYGTTRSKWDSVIDLDLLWHEYNRLIADNGVIALFGSEPFSSILRISNLKMFRYDWIWDKRKAGNFAQGNKQPLKIHEIISIFSKSNSRYYPQKTVLEKPETRHNRAKSKNREDRKHAGGIEGRIKYSAQYEPNKKLPVSIIGIKKDNYGKNIFHPAQKPVELLEYVIKTYSKEGDTILDNTMGSGSTGVACVNLNRNFIGIEKDCPRNNDRYFRTAIKRISVIANTDIDIIG